MSWNGEEQGGLKSGGQGFQSGAILYPLSFWLLGNRLTKVCLPLGLGVDLCPALAPKLTLLHSRWHSTGSPAEGFPLCFDIVSGRRNACSSPWAPGVLGALSNGFSSFERGPDWCQTGKSNSHFQPELALRLLSGRASLRAFQNLEPECFDFSASATKDTDSSAVGCLGAWLFKEDDTQPQWAWWQWSSGTWHPVWTLTCWCFFSVT